MPLSSVSANRSALSTSASAAASLSVVSRSVSAANASVSRFDLTGNNLEIGSLNGARPGISKWNMSCRPGWPTSTICAATG
jgi:hypothetical protein